MFSVLAVLSATALFFVVPRFAQSPLLYAVAVLILFAVEVPLFEIGIRRMDSQRNHDLKHQTTAALEERKESSVSISTSETKVIELQREISGLTLLAGRQEAETAELRHAILELTTTLNRFRSELRERNAHQHSPRREQREPMKDLLAPIKEALNFENLSQKERVNVRDIFKKLSEMQTVAVEPELRQIYNLTPIEARLATLLMDGKSLEESVAQLGIRRSTGRTYMQHLFEKVGVQRQSQLVSLLLKSFGLAFPTPNAVEAMATQIRELILDRERLETISLSSRFSNDAQRIVSYWVQGDKTDEIAKRLHEEPIKVQETLRFAIQLANSEREIREDLQRQLTDTPSTESR